MFLNLIYDAFVLAGKRERAEYVWGALHEKCPYSELFWSAFSRIRTEYGPE